MSRVLALVEGTTEKTFIEDILALHLGQHGVWIDARRVGKPGKKGGARPYQGVRKELLGLLKEDPSRFVTTMFDFYALPNDWPGRSEARKKGYPHNVEHVERELAADLSAALAGVSDVRRFLPYIQSHEYEALLFTRPDALASAIGRLDLAPKLAGIVKECGSPEEIDDDPNTAPSKRIAHLMAGYQKVTHGFLAAKGIGIPAMRTECPHFAQWLARLESTVSSG